MNIALYKTHIDNFLSKFDENVDFIYGGITEQSLEERKTQHIKYKQPTACNSSWIISNKAITTITIKNSKQLDTGYYNTLIAEVEQYLINELNKKYGNKCKNDKNRDGTISQRGGVGVQLQLDDAVKFYIFYKKSQ